VGAYAYPCQPLGL